MHFSFTVECDERRLSKSQRRLCVGILTLKGKYKVLRNFYRGLQYIGRRVPEEGQAERLMLKYYSFMWQIRQSLYENYGITVLQNLEKFQEYTGTDEQDKQYYELVANAFSTPKPSRNITAIRGFIFRKGRRFMLVKSVILR